MKKISLLVAATSIFVSSYVFVVSSKILCSGVSIKKTTTTAAAIDGKLIREMLKQLSDENTSLKPIIGNNFEAIERRINGLHYDTIYLLSAYAIYKHTDNGVIEADPTTADAIVVFQLKKDKPVLRFIDYVAGLELVKQNIDLLIPKDE